MVPLFPDLKPVLLEAFEKAEEGSEYVITRYRKTNANLRTQFERIIRRSGHQPWPKLFQNLRSTRETELTERFPLHVITAWIGNSELFAKRHYLQVTDEHFIRATSEETAQNAAQQLHATTRNRANQRLFNNEETEDDARECKDFPLASAFCQNGKVPVEGLEPTPGVNRNGF